MQTNRDDDQSAWHKIAGEDAFSCSEASDRIHACVEGRYISVLKHGGKLHCIDSICFHAGGPLALGDIEEIKSVTCIVCPWHYYCVSLDTGEKWYQSAAPDSEGKLHAGDWKSIGKRQRVHEVEQRPDGIYVKLDLEGHMASDEYACKHECGLRVKSGASRLTMSEMDGSRSPQTLMGPEGLTRISPRGSPLLEGEDVWPDDLTFSQRNASRGRSRSTSPKSRP